MEQLVNFIIRPPRAEYDPKSDLLDQEFMLKGQWFQRKDVEVTNSRGDVLQCSHYMPLIIPDGMKLPCVIYCHGNSGCRADASEAAIILLPSYITVFTLDFSGSGLSGGEHVTLGWNEKDDLKAVVDYLRSDGNISCIGLWGRSMGAVTSLLYGAEDLSIAGMVLDSPFSDLVDLMMELVDTYRFRFPKFTVKFAIQYMRRVIQKKAKFDIMDLNTIKVAKSCFVPVLIGHATDDDFIHPRHSELIYDAYVGDKNIIKFEGDHNSPRPQFYFDSITIFFHNVLQPPKDAIDGNYFDPADDYLGKASWDTMHDIGYANHSFMDSKGLGTSSTEDAINELRQKRSMSQMVVPSKIPCNETTSGKEDGHAKDPFPSSSGVISLEFSNGHPYVPLTPSTIDDDQYIEYPLENPSDFPCNTEEEDRMFMEAIIESLKHLDTHEQKQLQQAGTITPDLSREGPPSSQESEHSRLSKEDGSSASGTNNTNDLSCSSPDVSESSSAPTLGTPTSILESGSMGASTRSDRSVNGQNFTDGDKSITHDTAGGTRATLTVQKNPSGNIMDGLMHRWGLNFFKNS